MVQCPVGNRCPNCTKRFTSHVLQIDPWVIIRSLISGAIAGFLFALLQGFSPIGGFYMLFFVYLVGALIGNIIFKISGRKLGNKVAAAVGAGVLIGSLCTPFLWFNCISPIIGQEQNLSISTSEEQSDITNNTNDKSVTISVDEQTKMINRYQQQMPYPGFAQSPLSLSLIIFILGVISPFLGWNLGWPGFRRW